MSRTILTLNRLLINLDQGLAYSVLVEHLQDLYH